MPRGVVLEMEGDGAAKQGPPKNHSTKKGTQSPCDPDWGMMKQWSPRNRGPLLILANPCMLDRRNLLWLHAFGKRDWKRCLFSPLFHNSHNACTTADAPARFFPNSPFLRYRFQFGVCGSFGRSADGRRSGRGGGGARVQETMGRSVLCRRLRPRSKATLHAPLLPNDARGLRRGYKMERRRRDSSVLVIEAVDSVPD